MYLEKPCMYIQYKLLSIPPPWPNGSCVVWFGWMPSKLLLLLMCPLGTHRGLRLRKWSVNRCRNMLYAPLGLLYFSYLVTRCTTAVGCGVMLNWSSRVRAWRAAPRFKPRPCTVALWAAILQYMHLRSLITDYDLFKHFLFIWEHITFIHRVKKNHIKILIF